MKTVAFLWWENEVEWDQEKPFNKEWKNKDYAEYTELLREKDVRVVCGEYRWYSNGKMRKAFRWNGDKWEKIENIEIDGVYDLFRHDREKYGLKKQMQDEVKVLNDPEVAELCQDKLKTYREFKNMMSETEKASENNIRDMLSRNNKVVLKPRYGSGGHGIKKAETFSDIENCDLKDYLVQEFIDTEGIEEFGVDGPHDLRMLLVNGELINSYIRTPDNGFRSNVDQGGHVEYVDIENLPESAKDIASSVVKKMEDYRPYVISVDVMFDSENRPHLVELNSQPGIFVNRPATSKEKEEPARKALVELIADMVN